MSRHNLERGRKIPAAFVICVKKKTDNALFGWKILCMRNTTQLVQLLRSTGRRLALLCRIAAAAGVLVFGARAAKAQDPPPGAVLRPWEPADANRIPNKNDQLQMERQQQQQKQANYEVANLERKRQIAEDTEKILELAKDLKSEVDKTDKDMLSITVIRKAEMIEKLAKGVKEKMKLTVRAHS